MKTSESINNLAAALVALQSETEHANYDKTNPHFKSKYASLAEVIDVIKAPLAKHGLAVLALPGYQADVGYLLTTRLVHASGEWIETEMKLNPTKDDPQGLGSAITYMRRYTLPGIGLYASEEDDDGNAASRPKAQAPAMTPEQLEAKRQAYIEKRQTYLDKLATMTDETAIKTFFNAAATGLGLQKGTTEFVELRKLFVQRIEEIKPEFKPSHQEALNPDIT
jgi:hypothetical protein